MKNYINSFPTRDEYTLWKHSSKYTNPSTSYIIDENEVLYEDDSTSPYELQPFTFFIVQEGSNPPNFYRPYTEFDTTFTWDNQPFYCKVSIDGGHTWHTTTEGAHHWALHLKPTQQVQVISNGLFLAVDMWTWNWGEHPDGCTIGYCGNVLSLGGGAEMKIDFSDEQREKLGGERLRPWPFNRTGYDEMPYLVDCSNLYMPQEPWAGAYTQMFRNCYNLTTAPHIHFLNIEFPILSSTFVVREIAEGIVPTPTDMRNIVIDIPKNIRIESPVFDFFAALKQMSYFYTMTSNHFTGKGTNIFPFALHGTDAPSIPEMILHNMYLEYTLNGTYLSNLSNMSLYNCSVYGMMDNGANIVKSPKFYSISEGMAPEMFSSCDNLTDLYLYTITIPAELYFDNNSWSNVTIHYAPWCNNLSDAQGWYSDATFALDNTANFLITLEQRDLYYAFADIDSVTYRCASLKWNENYLANTLWTSNDQIHQYGDNQWFFDNLKYIATHVIWAGETYALTYLGDEEVTLYEDITDTVTVSMFSFTIGATTYKIGLGHFYDQNGGAFWWMLIPTESTFTYNDLNVVFSYNTDNTALNVKYIN